MRKYIFLFFVVITFTNCNNLDCADFATGPPIISVELVDAVSEENIFTSGLYQTSDIQMVDSENRNVNFYFINENNYNIIQFVPYSYSEPNIVFINVKDVISAKITFDIKKVQGDCYTTYYVENIVVENYPFQMNTASGILTIKV